MIDTTPQPDTTYKFAKVDMSMYLTKETKVVLNGKVVDLNAVPHWTVAVIAPQPDEARPLLDSLVRDDLLPDWVHEYMRTLDVAGSGHSVPGVGKKIGSVYWINVTDEI